MLAGTQLQGQHSFANKFVFGLLSVHIHTPIYMLERQVERYKKLVEKIPPEIMAQIKGSKSRDERGDR